MKQIVGIDTGEVRTARIGIRGGNDLVWIRRAANYAAKLTGMFRQAADLDHAADLRPASRLVADGWHAAAKHVDSPHLDCDGGASHLRVEL